MIGGHFDAFRTASQTMTSNYQISVKSARMEPHMWNQSPALGFGVVEGPQAREDSSKSHLVIPERRLMRTEEIYRASLMPLFRSNGKMKYQDMTLNLAPVREFPSINSLKCDLMALAF